MSIALALIDIQRDYFPGGRMELTGMDLASEKARELLAFFRERKWPLFHVQHLSVRPNATFFLPGTDGCELHENVAPAAGEKIIQKNYPNAFRETNLREELRKLDVKELVICGAMSHMCVEATTRAAFDLGFRCVVAHDACATKDLTFKGRTIAAEDVHSVSMAALGAVYAEIAAAQEIISKIESAGN